MQTTNKCLQAHFTDTPVQTMVQTRVTSIWSHITGEHHITWLTSSWEYTTITKSWFQSFCQIVFI